ncbi:MFS general substrate transporter [Aspergillus campestris IBT 28561]|uniref:MFS general substrate transporter n=1 Tax=Aspergillus campestris (strain IBT 28561) TaxID=1392248 RepID=A0A2I1CSM0_ASPC2|nr:MFS general substrate transporter [Aspergillus campestris IBT 28561]PKY00611.1 MFS general substrate transporter [Aspergillus campestris IBT 28561]
MSGDVQLERNITRREHQILLDVDEFATRYDLGHIRELLKKAALIAHNPSDLARTEGLNQEEIAILSGKDGEYRHGRCTPFQSQIVNSMMLIYLAAAVYGMAHFSAWTYISLDQWYSAPNTLESVTFNAPHIGSALVGCWCTVPLNRAVGRRGAIFTAMGLIILTSIAGSLELWPVANLIQRFCLGVSFGLLECTIPVYCVETSPDHQRGRVTGAWQMGSLFGQVLVVTLMLVVPVSWIYLSISICAGAICVGCWFVPESPRWLVCKGQMLAAFDSLRYFRPTGLLAARDLYLFHIRSETTGVAQSQRAPLLHLFTNPRASRATLAAVSVIVPRSLSGYHMAMATQNLKGTDYDTTIAWLFVTLGYTLALFTSMFTVVLAADRASRRKLLLWTILPMACVMGFYPIGWGFAAQQTIGIAAKAILIVMYNIGQVPLSVYVAESFPIQYRDYGMAFTISMYHGSFAAMRVAMPNLVYWPHFRYTFAVCNLIAFILAFFLMRETKNLALEEVPLAFEAPTRNLILYRLSVEIPYFFRRHVLRQNVQFLPFEDSKYGGGAIVLDTE